MRKILLSSLLVLSATSAFAVPVDLDFSIRYKNKLYPKGSEAVIENSMRHAVYLKERIMKGQSRDYQVHIKNVDDEDGVWFRFGKTCEFIYGFDDLAFRLAHAPSRQLDMEVYKDSRGEEQCTLHIPN